MEHGHAFDTRVSHVVAMLKDSITDGEGRARYEILRDASYLTPLLSVFVSDGAFAMFLLLAVEIPTTVISLDPIAYYYSPTFPWLHAIFSHVGSRLILNLRIVGGRGTPTEIFSRYPGRIHLEAMSDETPITFTDGHMPRPILYND